MDLKRQNETNRKQISLGFLEPGKKTTFLPPDRLLRQRRLPRQPAHGVAGGPARVRHQHRRQPAAVPLGVLGGSRPAQHPGRAGEEDNIFHRGRSCGRSEATRAQLPTFPPKLQS